MATARRLLPRYDMSHAGADALTHEIGLPPSTGRVASRSLEDVLRRRRSIRSYADRPLTLGEIGQLLWAAQGITRGDGLRTAPSAGALYPLEVFLVASHVEDLSSGSYRYSPVSHALRRVVASDLRHALAAAALGQECVAQAPAVLTLTAVFGRTTRKYGERGVRYAHLEAGHAAQNVCLQAAALGLGVVVVGAFEDDEVRRVIGAARTETPLCLLPVGRPG